MRFAVLVLLLSSCSAIDPRLDKCNPGDMRTRMEMAFPDGERASAVICLGVVGPARIYTK